MTGSFFALNPLEYIPVVGGFLLLVGLNLLLVTLGGIFLNQEARRRRNEAQEAEERNVQLAQAVNERTAELTGLSHHLQRLQEEEKAKIALYCAQLGLSCNN